MDNPTRQPAPAQRRHLRPELRTATPLFSITGGSLTLNFSDESSASANFDSVRENFGQGQFELERLAKPMLAECD